MSELQQPTTQSAGKDLLGIFVRHPVAANLLMLVFIVTGAIGLFQLNAQSLPTFPLNYIIVQTEWSGATAEDVEQSVTFPLEQELRNLDNLKEMRSTSTTGLSYVSLEFKSGTDMGLAMDQVTDLVSQVRNLPETAKSPNIRKFLRNEDVATMVISSHGDFKETRQLAYQFERELLDRGIGKIEFVGLAEQEVAIQVGAAQIGRLKQSLVELGQNIQSRSQDIPAGIVGRDVAGRELRSLEQRRDPQDFERLAALSDESGRLLHVGDVANVVKRPKPGQPLVYFNGRPAIEMRLLRPASADSLKMARILNTWLEEKRAVLPDTVDIQVYNQAWQLIEERIDLLTENALAGLLLVLIVLYLFLNGRVAFWVAIGIPIAFLGTFYLLHLFGGSLNMVSLFALIMALGIVVDDAIVVGEEAYTQFQRGTGAAMSAENGARRMWNPVLSSSATTIAAFLPLMLVSGVIGDIMFTIPLVIICVILASLVESFLILPNHLNTSFQHDQSAGRFRQRFDQLFDGFRGQVFRQLLLWTLRYRLATLSMVVGLLILSIGLIQGGRVPFTFFQAPVGVTLTANVKFAASIPSQQVSDFASHMEEALWQANEYLKREHGLTEGPVKLAIRRDHRASFLFAPGMLHVSGEQYAMVQVELNSPDERPFDNQEIVERWQERLQLPPGIEQLSIEEPREGPPGRDLDIFLTGNDSTVLKAASEELADVLSTFPGVYNIRDDLPYGKEQLIYQLTPLGRSLGLDISQVGQQLKAAFEGLLLQAYYEDQDKIDVKIMLADSERNRFTMIEQFPIAIPSGEIVPLSNVVSFKVQRGAELLRHTQGILGVHVTADVDSARSNANEVLDSLADKQLPGISARHGVQIELKGRAQEQSETVADLTVGLILAITLIYITLALIFSSYSWPIAVMAAIPFGISGAILGHWVLDIDLTLMSLFGFFGLSGIVINDSIILISFYKELRGRGMSVRDAITESSCQRLRAVLLTSLTTIAGLLPLIFDGSSQAEFLKPMAVSISFGLAFSTILVLIVIPILLSYIEVVVLYLSRNGKQLDAHHQTDSIV